MYPEMEKAVGMLRYISQLNAM